MKVCFDIDGVLSDFETNAALVANSIWPGSIPAGYKPSDWDWTDVLTKDDWTVVWEEIHKIPNFWTRQGHYLDSITDLRIFLREFPQVELLFLTARMDTGGVAAHEQTYNWLKSRGLVDGLWQLKVVSDPKEKFQILRDENIRFMVDDKKETVEACNNGSYWSKAFLFDQPWNQTSNQPRVYSVREFCKIISEELSQE